MSRIDDRIVNMHFNNGQFERGIQDSIGSLDNLNNALQLEEPRSVFGRILDFFSDFRGPIGGIADAVDNISSRFSVLGAVGFTVIQDLTRSAMDFVRRIGTNIFEPIFGGGRQRALNIEQAKFQFEGLGMDIDKTMESALEAVKGTAFGLDEAAVVAANFGATGMKAGDEMTAALRGISGVAAMAGASYSDVGNIFSTVAGQGRLMGNDLNRLAARGVNAAATLADAMGITESEVREMVTKGEISFQMFADAMNDAFGEHATKANETYTGSLSNLRAALARIGAALYTPQLERHRDIFNSITPVIDTLAEHLEPVIDLFEEFTHFSADNLINFFDNLDLSGLESILPPLVDAIRIGGQTIVEIGKAIYEAWTDVFPPATTAQITGIAEGLKSFAANVKEALTGTDGLQRTLRGLFSIFGIVWEIGKQVVLMFADIFGVSTEGAQGILEFTGSIGDWLYNVHQAIKGGEGLTTFFNGLKRVIEVVRIPFEIVIGLVGYLMDLFTSSNTLDGSVLSSPFSELVSVFEPLNVLSDLVAKGWEKVIDALLWVWQYLEPFVGRIGEAINNIVAAIIDGFATLDFDQVLAAFNSGLLAGFLTILTRFFGNIQGVLSGEGPGIVRSVKFIFGNLNTSLRVFQDKLKADILMKLAAAILVLALAVALLAMIDPVRLASATAGIAAMFAQLLGAVALFERASPDMALLKMTATAAAMTVLAVAILILSAAVKVMSTMSWEELAKGLAGTAALLVALSGATKIISGASGRLISASVGIIALSVGILILTSAVERLSDLSWEDLGRGLAGVGALLAQLAIFTRLVAANKMGAIQGAGLILLAVAIGMLADSVEQFGNMDTAGLIQGLVALGAVLTQIAIFSRVAGKAKGMVSTAVGLTILGAALKIIASAMKDMADLSWGEIARGLVGMAGALAVIAVAMHLMPKNMLVSAASLVVVAAALDILAGVMQSLGGMTWGEIAKSLVALAGALVIIAGAMMLMTGALAGAAALIIVAGALAVLTPVLKDLGNLSWGELGMALASLAASFALIAAAGLLLTPVVPTLIGLGAAVALLGVGALAAGAGLLALSTGLTALAAAGTAGIIALTAMIMEIIKLIPEIAVALAEGLLAFVQVIVEAAPQIVDALVTLLLSLIDAIVQVIPEAIDAFVEILMTFLEAVDIVGPKAIETLFELLQAFVDEIEDHIPQFVEAGVNIIYGVLDGIANRMHDIVTAAGRIATEFIRGIGDNTRGFIDAGADAVVDVLEGIENAIPRIAQAATDVVIAFIEAIGEQHVRLVNAGWDIVIEVIDGIADSIDRNHWRLSRAGRNLGRAMMDGLTGGLWSKASEVTSSAWSVARDALNSAKSALGISSPSKEFALLGRYSDEGFAQGLNQFSHVAERASSRVGNNTLESMREAISGIPDMFSDTVNMNPTIRPVLDLSDISRNSDLINSMLNPDSYHRARGIAIDRRNIDRARFDNADAASRSGDVTFTQNNYSPRSLTTADIYRQTKNQFALAKERLNVP